MGLYIIANGPIEQGTSPLAIMATGTSVKTLLQVKPGPTQTLRIVEWGISFDGDSAATPGSVELIETDVAATVTASVASDIGKEDGEALLAGDPTTNIFSVGTSATGYNASAEGSITTVRHLDAPQLIAPTNQYVKQLPLGREGIIQPGKFARIRVKLGTSVNAYCYMILQS